MSAVRRLHDKVRKCFSNTTTQWGIVETNFGLKFQKINIDFQKCLLLLAGVCPDVSHKANYSPDNKRYIQIFHG